MHCFEKCISVSNNMYILQEHVQKIPITIEIYIYIYQNNYYIRA